MATDYQNNSEIYMNEHSIKDHKEKQMENVNNTEVSRKNGNFQWRWVITGAAIVLIIVSLAAVAGFSYKLGHEHGYNQLEREIVYALALNKSKHVGKFLVAKLENGGTVIALNELQFSVEVDE